MAWRDAHQLVRLHELALHAAVVLRAEILEVDRPAVNALALLPHRAKILYVCGPRGGEVW